MQNVIVKLLISDPYYGYLASGLRIVKSIDVKKMRISFQSEPTILYNESWFGSLNENIQISIVVRKLLHIALLHNYRRNGRKTILWSVSCDIAVSELMWAYEIEEDGITRPKIARQVGVKLKEKQNAEYYYKILNEIDETRSLLFSLSKDNIVFDDGETLSIEILEDVNEDDLTSKASVKALSEMKYDATNEGVLNDELMDQLADVYEAEHVQWKAVLKRFLSGHGRIKTRKSHKRVSRRFEDMPGTKRSEGIRALIAVDESGSISDAQVETFHKELVRINRMLNDEIFVCRFDTECTEPLPLSMHISQNRRERKGGTDFRPVFKLADQLGIRNLIIFTDGDGKTPLESNQRVLWVLTNTDKKPTTFGSCIRLNRIG